MNNTSNIELVIRFKCASLSEANHMVQQAMAELGNETETPLFKQAEVWVDMVKVQTSTLNAAPFVSNEETQ